MCEFTVYLDGHDEDNIVAERIIKATVKEEFILLNGSDGKSFKIANSRITKVDTIMTELHLVTNSQ